MQLKQTALRTLRALAIVCLAISGIQMAAAHAAGVWNVDVDTGTDPGGAGVCNSTQTYRTLTYLFASACPQDGDTVDVAASATAYAGGFTIGHSISLQKTGAGTVTINGGGPVITILSGTTVSITGVTIQGGNNPDTTLGAGGGGIDNAGSLALTASVVRANQAYVGGGIFNKGTLTVSGSTIGGPTTADGNAASDGCAGIDNWNGGSMTVTDSTVTDNTTPHAGGGICTDFGNATTIVSGSTIDDNTALDEGGLDLTDGVLTVVNSTVWHNTATCNDPNNCYGGGGIGVFSGSGSVSITNSTIADNVSDLDGGGIYMDGGHNTAVTLNNTIITGNNAAGSGKDCVDASTLGRGYVGGPVQDGPYAHNLLNNSGGCSQLTSSSDVVLAGSSLSAAGLASSLAGNGGPTQTVALQPGSPAIDAGSNAACETTGPGGVNSVDQRGYNRYPPGDSVCDIGSYEYNARAPWVVDGDTGTDPTGSGVCNAGLTYRTLTYLFANNCPLDGDTVDVAASTLAYSGGVTISHSITLQKTGSGTVTIDGGGPVITVAGGATVSVSGVTVEGGSNSSPGDGGGIDNAGTLTLTDTTVDGNSAVQGGGISNGGELTLTDSTVEGNSAALGGGIYNANTGTVTLSGSTIGGPTSDLHNAATSDGGGIFSQGTLTLSTSTVTNNSSGGDGGGILSTGTLTLSTSTDSSNTAQGDGGGMSAAGTTLVSRSTIDGNTATDGGAMVTEGGSATVVNSTLWDNTANPPSVSGGGGGVFVDGGSVNALNSTIADNMTSTGSGGGVMNAAGSTTLDNSIVMGNSASSSGAGEDCSGTVSDGAYAHDLRSYSGGCTGLTDATDVVASSSGLAAGLANNGGPTQTVALLAQSPAVNTGSNTACETTGASGVNTIDQRGDSRYPNGDSVCDIGAYEFSGYATVTAASPTTTYGQADVTVMYSTPSSTICQSGPPNPYCKTRLVNPIVTCGYGGAALPAIQATGLTTARSGADAGTYPTYCWGAYDPSDIFSYVPGTLTINPALVTIKPDGATITRGAPLSRLRWRANFVNHDTAASLSRQPSCTAHVRTNRQDRVISPAGIYTIRCAGAKDPNYRIHYATGRLRVVPQRK